LAVATGVAVANVYYVQPVLALMASDLHVSPRSMGTIAMMMQVGYALGIVGFVPLGDIVQRRGLIVGMFALTALFLVGVAVAPWYGLVALGILLVGITTTAPQLLMPFAADLATTAERGHVVGVIQTGLVIGTVGARALGGLIGAHAGWRAVFAFAAVVAAIATVVLSRVLPLRAPNVTLRYADVMRSLPGFVVRYPVLRISMGLGFISFGSVAGLWTVLAFRAHAIGFGSRARREHRRDRRPARYAFHRHDRVARHARVIRGARRRRRLDLGPRRRCGAARGRHAADADLQSSAHLRARRFGAQPHQHGLHVRQLRGRRVRCVPGGRELRRRRVARILRGDAGRRRTDGAVLAVVSRHARAARRQIRAGCQIVLSSVKASTRSRSS
jgi:hypothetical protein